MTRTLMSALALLIFTAGPCTSQDFEGVVTYRCTYESRSPNYPVETLIKQFGTYTKTYIKNGFFMDVSDGEFMSCHLFRHDSAALYFRNAPPNDTLWYRPIASGPTEEFQFEVFPASDTVNGILCHKLVRTQGRMVTTYWYSPEYSQNPDYYMDFTYGSKNRVMEEMKAIYLKLSIDMPPFTFELVYDKIERTPLEDSIFYLPKHKYLLRASPEN